MDSKTFDGLVRVLGGSTNRRSMIQILGGLSFGVIALSPTASEAKRKGKGNGKKVTVCHQGQTISVSKSALKSHLQHGDTMGACPGQEDARSELTICTDGVKNGTETDVDCGGDLPPLCHREDVCQPQRLCECPL